MNDRNIMRAPSATKSTILNSMAYPSCLRPSTPGFPKSSSSAGGHTASTAIIPSHKRFDTKPLLTLDTDVAIPGRLEAREQNLRQRLTSAGFRERFLGEHQPPATRYQLGDEEGSFYVEFLTPLIGSEHDRRGNRRATRRVAGVTSQNLRYVDVLLGSPWKVKLSQANGFPFEDPKQIQIAHPTRFMAQKLLIHDRRERRSRAKDSFVLARHHRAIWRFARRTPRRVGACGKTYAFGEPSSHHRGRC
jgi:hypothetical protein